MTEPTELPKQWSVKWADDTKLTCERTGVLRGGKALVYYRIPGEDDPRVMPLGEWEKLPDERDQGDHIKSLETRIRVLEEAVEHLFGIVGMSA